MHTHTRTYMHMCTCIYTYIHAHVHTHKSTNTHTRIHTRTRTHIHAHTHTSSLSPHTHAHAHILNHFGGGYSPYTHPPTPILTLTPPTPNLILTRTCKTSCAPYQGNERVCGLHTHNPLLPFSYSHEHALTPAAFFLFLFDGVQSSVPSPSNCTRTHTHTHTHTRTHPYCSHCLAFTRTFLVRIFLSF